MRYLNRFLYLLLLVSLIVFQPNAVNAKGDKNTKRNNLNKVNGTPAATWFTINNIATILRNDGDSDLNGNDSGFEYPNGSNKTVFFESGFLYGGLYKDEWRVGGSTYNHSQVPGRILDDGSAEDPTLPHVRIYRVRRDFRDADADFSKEIDNDQLSEAEIVAQYESDWNQWPWQYGAPYEDVDGNGQYNPSLDIPGVPGADQTIWFVCNDLDPSANQQFYGTLGLGFEMQATIWGYNKTGALGNALFRRYTLINKGGENIDSMYVCMWSDPDLGDAGDDFTGCDTTLSLGYIYNGGAVDAMYGPNVPAGGFDFFQGPVVEGLPTDEAIFKGKVIQGYKNLPMSAFFFFINSDNVYRDPTLNQPIGATQMRNLFEGKISTTGVPFTDPLTGQATKFTLSGDPITSRGWVDGILHSPGDRRLGMVAGPFTCAAGDTQEVVVGQFVAGATEGIDRLGAVGLLKFYDLELQLAYDNFFQVPPAVRAPVVTASALDGKVSLVWGDRQDIIAQTESYDNLGYKFEGYCVYQLPSGSATLEQAKLVETYDVQNLVQSIESTVFDVTTNTSTKKFTKFGSDSGIKRSIIIENDAVRNGVPIVNGTHYYFAVTAYAYNPDPMAVPNVLETPLTILDLVPQSPNPGVSMGTAGDLLTIAHQGNSDGRVEVEVLDPSRTTGNNYKVTFRDTDEGTVWDLTNVTTGQVRVSGGLQEMGNESPIADGLHIRVFGPPPGMKDWSIPSGTRRWTWAGGASGFGMEGFEGAMGIFIDFWGSSLVGYDGARDVLLKLSATDTEGNILNPNDADVSLAYRWVRSSQNAPAKPEFEGKYQQIPNYDFQDYVPIPIAAYNTETNPPTRLSLGFLENNQVNGMVDGKHWPPDYNVGDNTASTGPREWLFIMNVPYTETPDPNIAVNFLNNDLPIMWISTAARRGNIAYADEDEFQILANHINTPEDVFTFTAPAVTFSADKAKEDVEKINAFPNPYYGVNPREVNKYQKFITFSHLPQKATLRIFNLAGQLVATINKDDVSPFATWDLSNDADLPVASGLYIVHVDMPEIGATKILKVAIIQEQQILDRF